MQFEQIHETLSVATGMTAARHTILQSYVWILCNFVLIFSRRGIPVCCIVLNASSLSCDAPLVRGQQIPALLQPDLTGQALLCGQHYNCVCTFCLGTNKVCQTLYAHAALVLINSFFLIWKICQLVRTKTLFSSTSKPQTFTLLLYKGKALSELVSLDYSTWLMSYQIHIIHQIMKKASRFLKKLAPTKKKLLRSGKWVFQYSSVQEKELANGISLFLLAHLIVTVAELQTWVLPFIICLFAWCIHSSQNLHLYDGTYGGLLHT